jgi:hypothetical protein
MLMRFLLILSFMYCSSDCYSCDLVANDHFSSTLAIHPFVSDTIVPSMSLPEGVKKIEYKEEEKKYRLWVKISLASSWATLLFFFLAAFFFPLWGSLCIATIIFSLVWAIDVLHATKHRPMFRKVRKWAKWAIFIPILYVFAAILAGIGLIFIYLGD